MEWKRIGIVMAGGSGERFWPVSTPERPKQFLKLADPEKSLIQQSVERARHLGDAFVATNHLLSKQTQEACGLDPDHVYGEPERKNTLGCLVWVAASALHQFGADADRVSMAILTADHNIGPMSAFIDCANAALSAAEETGAIAVIGIKPDRPETGYGYVEAAQPGQRVSPVARFHEKPNLETAEKYFKNDHFSWNSGMFFLTLRCLIKEFERQMPDVAKTVHAIAEAMGRSDTETARHAFAQLPSASFDKAIMEGASRVVVVQADFSWDDLGSWDALRRSMEGDGSGNVTVGDARYMDAKANSVYVEGTQQRVSVLGLEGIVVVVTAEHVMVLPESRAQDVKALKQL